MAIEGEDDEKKYIFEPPVSSPKSNRPVTVVGQGQGAKKDAGASLRGESSNGHLMNQFEELKKKGSQNYTLRIVKN